MPIAMMVSGVGLILTGIAAYLRDSQMTFLEAIATGRRFRASWKKLIFSTTMAMRPESSMT
jgi:hypothetical protein